MKSLISVDGGETYKEIICLKESQLNIPDIIVRALISKDNNILMFDDGYSVEVDGDIEWLVVGQQYEMYTK